jgi:hypothetical protein
MMPLSVTDLGTSTSKYTDASWQKTKLGVDKIHKTGIGVALTAVQNAYKSAKEDLKKLDVMMIGKLTTEDEVRAKKKVAQQTLAAGTVKTLIATLGTSSSTIETGAKKLSIISKTAALKLATGLRKMKTDLEGEKFADFDNKETSLRAHYAAQRLDFKNATKLLVDLIRQVDAAPTLKSVSGTTYSGPIRNFQNKVGNLPEFKDIFQDKYDGLIAPKLQGKTPEAVKSFILAYNQELRNYIAKVVQRAKEKGF